MAALSTMAATARASSAASAGTGTAAAAIVPASALVDDRGSRLDLAAAPRRIVSLAPHATELLFAAGLGERVVAVDPASDHPPAARHLPKVGALPEPPIERLLALRPDLVVAWAAAVRPGFVERMASLGIPVFVSDPRTLDAVATTLRQFARLAATPAGLMAAADFETRLAVLRTRWSGRPPVAVFVQISAAPLITLTGRDLIGAAIADCGGRNLANGLPGAAPPVDAEWVLAAAPQLLVATDSPASETRWQQLGLLRPQGSAHFAYLDPTVLQRPGPRVLEPVEALCQAIDAAR